MTDKIRSHYSLTRNEAAMKKVGVSAAEIMLTPANCIRKTLCVQCPQWRKRKLLIFSVFKNLWLLGSWKSSNASKPAYWHFQTLNKVGNPNPGAIQRKMWTITWWDSIIDAE